MSANESQQCQPRDAAELAAVLSQRQYLRPHRPLNEVLKELEICQVAIEQAMRWLGLEGARPIGRIRATQLAQLARCIYRIWEAAKGNAEGNPQPA